MTDATARPAFSHAVRTSARAAGPDRETLGGPLALAETPLVAARSLGALLGLGSLAFKLESCQPTGSWLDRAAAVTVQWARDDGHTGLCLVEAGPLALPLAVQCARAGLRLVVLRPASDAAHDRATKVPGRAVSTDGWLAALGARQVAVDAGRAALAATASRIAERAGLWLVEAGGCDGGIGLEAVAAEIAAAGHGGSLLVVPDLTGAEPATLAALDAERPAALPLPLAGLAEAAPGGPVCPFAVVGQVRPRAGDQDAGEAPGGRVLSVAVSARQADAARALLAREEGLLPSPAGAAALAALIRTVRADRARRPRDRRVPRDLAAVVVLTGDPLWGHGGPPPAADAVPGRTVSLAELEADPGRLLVEPPGWA